MAKKNKKIKIAIVVDSLEKKGGAEQVLKSLLDIYPSATVYTVRSDKKFVKSEFPKVKVINSFIQYFPFEKYLRKELFLLYPLAYRLFFFLQYDAVISVSASFAKFVKPLLPSTKHIGYVLTPPRFFWMQEARSNKDNSSYSYRFYNYFRNTILEDIWKKWDRKAAKNIDKIISISNEVAKRVRDFYGLESDVIYPPVNVSELPLNKNSFKRSSWYLYHGRVETYKGVELAIRAAVLAHTPLKISGIGNDLEDMRELVRELNAKGIVKFLGFTSEEQKIDLLMNCRALIFPAKNEDFGIVPVEANACGAPVIAYRSGGVTETISDNNPKTGEFFDEYEPEALAEILKNFDIENYDPKICRNQASNFSEEIFKYKFSNLVNDVLKSGK